jgi:hypothetical protein
MHKHSLTTIFGILIFSSTIVSAKPNEVNSTQFVPVTSALPSSFDHWKSNLPDEYRKAFVSVMNEWYRGKSPEDPKGEDEMINRFINSPKDKPIECKDITLWQPASKKDSFAAVVCVREDFHITLVAWTVDSKDLMTNHLVGDKARPVTVNAVAQNKDGFILNVEQPPYEGGGIWTCLMKWNGSRFVASDWTEK